MFTISLATATDSGSFSCFTSSSMILIFAWWVTSAERSSALIPATSSACWATFTISQTAHLNTVRPSWRIVGQPASPSLKSRRDPVMLTEDQCEPSEPQTVGEIPASSEGPTMAAPAPSPRRNEIERSVGSMKSLSFSPPTTKTYLATPDRTSASA